MYGKFQELLKERGVTVSDVSKATGVKESTLSMWKARNTNLSFDHLVKIAQYFAVPLDYFVTRKEDK